ELRRVDAERLIDLYTKHGLLGTHDAIQDRSRFAQSVISDPIAVACCRILNDFRPLEKIIESLIREASEQDLARYVTVALAHFCYRSGIRYEILVATCGRRHWREQ